MTLIEPLEISGRGAYKCTKFRYCTSGLDLNDRDEKENFKSPALAILVMVFYLIIFFFRFQHPNRLNRLPDSNGCETMIILNSLK